MMASNVSLGDYKTKCLFIEAMLCDLLQLILNEINISMSEANCLKKTTIDKAKVKDTQSKVNQGNTTGPQAIPKALCEYSHQEPSIHSHQSELIHEPCHYLCIMLMSMSP